MVYIKLPILFSVDIVKESMKEPSDTERDDILKKTIFQL